MNAFNIQKGIQANSPKHTFTQELRAEQGAEGMGAGGHSGQRPGSEGRCLGAQRAHPQQRWERGAELGDYTEFAGRCTFVIRPRWPRDGDLQQREALTQCTVGKGAGPREQPPSAPRTGHIPEQASRPWPRAAGRLGGNPGSRQGLILPGATAAHTAKGMQERPMSAQTVKQPASPAWWRATRVNAGVSPGR